MTKLVTGSVSSPNIDQMAGYDSLNWIFAHEFEIGSITLYITVIWWLLFVGLAAYVLQRTKIGNWIYAVGGNAASARAVGVPVTAVKVGLFMTVAFLGWFTGMHYLYNFNVLQAGNGVGTSSSTSSLRSSAARCSPAATAMPSASPSAPSSSA